MHDTHYYRSLKRSIVTIVLVVSLSPLLLISAMTAYLFHTAYQEKVLAHLSEVVEKHAREIDRFLFERLAQLKVAARTYSFQQLSSDAFLNRLLRTLQEENQGMFVDLGLIDNSGIQVAYAGPFSLVRADYAGAEWFEQAMRSEIYLSDVFLGLRRLPHFIVAVRQNWNGRQWILRATIDFVTFNRLVEAGWIEDLLSEEPIRDSENGIEISRALEQIRTQGRRCKQITHKLLSFARKTDPRVQQIRINDLVEEILSLSEQRVRYANVRVQAHLTPNLPPVSISPSEMQQVMLNLVNNAVDAMEKQGGTLEITTRPNDGQIVVDVADTGPGIPKAVLQRVFDPFFTTKPVGKGTASDSPSVTES